MIKAGARLDRHFFAWCESVDYGVSEILALFPKAGESSEKIRYSCELLCPTCKTWREKKLGRSGVQKWISYYRSAKAKSSYSIWEFECEGCEAAREEERRRSFDPDSTKKYLARLRQEEIEKARQRTPAFVGMYLKPGWVWKPEIPEDQRFPMMTREPVDDDAVAAAVRSMSKRDFLHSMYWQAVHSELMRRADGKCTICAQTEPLKICYRSYEKHGYEHTEDGLKEILCLCERCHNTYFLKTDVSRN